MERVREELLENGVRSSRRNGLGVSQSSFVRIVRELKFHPYILTKRQKLEIDDPARRLEFCNWLFDTVAQNPDEQPLMSNLQMMSNLITSDEAIFSLNSEVNRKNVVHYAQSREGHPENHFVNYKQGAGQLMVWVGLMKNGAIFGPHFIEGRLDSREYLRIVRYNVIQREFNEQGIDRQRIWWQQDGAPAHTSNQCMQYLMGQLPGKVISKRGDIMWPPRSPDLAICDFFLWGYLKQTIWNVPVELQPQNLQQLRDAIIRACNGINRDMIANSFDGMLKRCRKCIAADGHIFENEEWYI